MNIIALQCCVRVSWITSSISHRYIYTHSLLNLPPTISVSPLQPSQSPALSSLCYGAASHLLPVLHIVVNICQGYSLHWAPSHSPAVSTGLIFIFVMVLTYIHTCIRIQKILLVNLFNKQARSADIKLFYIKLSRCKTHG